MSKFFTYLRIRDNIFLNCTLIIEEYKQKRVFYPNFPPPPKSIAEYFSQIAECFGLNGGRVSPGPGNSAWGGEGARLDHDR